MKFHSLIIDFNTERQALKCFGVLFLNTGYLGKLEISKYSKTVSFSDLPFKHMINKQISLIEKRKLKYKRMIIKIKTIEKEEVILKEFEK